MRISLKADYAIRAMAELAVADGGAHLNAEAVAGIQQIPLRFLLNILNELRRAGLVYSQRGPSGGYGLARPATEIDLAEIIRAVEGPLANVHEMRPEQVRYQGASESLRDVWIAVRVSLRAVLEEVTLDDLVHGRLPAAVLKLTEHPEALRPH